MTADPNHTSRARFEAWANDKFAPGRFSFAKSNGEYIDDDVLRLWRAFQHGEQGKREVVDENARIRKEIYEAARKMDYEMDEVESSDLAEQLRAIAAICSSCFGNGYEEDAPDPVDGGGGTYTCTRCHGSGLAAMKGVGGMNICECANWARTDLSHALKSRDGIPLAPNHHPDCTHYNESLMDVWKVTCCGSRCYVDSEVAAKEMQSLEEAGEDPVTVEKFRMHREIFENLPEFQGY